MRHMLVDGREGLPAVTPRILYLLADLAQRFPLPRHRLRRDMPQRVARNAGLLIVRALVAGRAAHGDRALVVGTADHQRRMRMTVIALRRPLADRMAIQATWVLQDSACLDEQSACTLVPISKRLE